MTVDIFSSYIKKQQGGAVTEAPQRPASVNSRPQTFSSGESIDILKEISAKLDRLGTGLGASADWNATAVSAVPFAGTEVDLAIENGSVVLPDNGVFQTNVYIKDGKIFSLGNDKSVRAKRTIDARGRYVLPGIIDPHVHLGLFAPLSTELATETRSALMGGVTTIGVHFGGPESHFRTFPQIMNEIGRTSYTDIIPHLVIGTEEQKKELGDCVRHLGITSFKVYMNGIPGMIPDVDDAFIMDVFEEMKRSGKPCILCSHAENRDLVRRANALVRAEKGERASVQDWTDTHPAMAEEEAVMRLSFLAQQSGVPVYFVHMSSKEAIARLREIKPKNRLVHVETTSPYLSVTKNNSGTYDIKMEPPFRGEADVEALWRAVDDGIIDTIGTDNVTQTRAEKNESGSMWDAIPGYPALETHLPVLLSEGVVKRGLPIEHLITHMTKKPAEIFGVYPRKGTLLPGSDADVAIVDLNLTREVSAGQLSSRSDFSIYEGKRVTGWPVMTIKGGNVMVENGIFVGGPSTGSCLQR